MTIEELKEILALVEAANAPFCELTPEVRAALDAFNVKLTSL